MIILGLLLEVMDLSGADLDNVTRPGCQPTPQASRRRPPPRQTANPSSQRSLAGCTGHGKEPNVKKRNEPPHWQHANALRRIPIEVQREGLSLASLQASLRGRWRGLCHPGELGTALRTLGFKRKRRWYDDSGFQSVWRKTRDQNEVANVL